MSDVSSSTSSSTSAKDKNKTEKKDDLNKLDQTKSTNKNDSTTSTSTSTTDDASLRDSNNDSGLPANDTKNQSDADRDNTKGSQSATFPQDDDEEEVEPKTDQEIVDEIDVDTPREVLGRVQDTGNRDLVNDSADNRRGTVTRTPPVHTTEGGTKFVGERNSYDGQPAAEVEVVGGEVRVLDEKDQNTTGNNTRSGKSTSSVN